MCVPVALFEVQILLLLVADNCRQLYVKYSVYVGDVVHYSLIF